MNVNNQQTEWTDEELSATLHAYIEMLGLEQRNQPYVKTRYNEQLRKSALKNRTKSSVEFRMRNISYVMESLGLPRIKGYYPAENIALSTQETIKNLLKNYPQFSDSTVNKTNRDKVLTLLKSLFPQALTNSEISLKTGIQPHQQVFQITKSLMDAESITGIQNGKEWFFSFKKDKPLEEFQPSKFVQSVKELYESVRSFSNLETSPGIAKKFYLKRIGNGKMFVAFKNADGSYLFAPGAYVAHKDRYSFEEWNILKDKAYRGQGRNHFDRALANSKVETGGNGYKELREAYIDFCTVKGAKISKHGKELSFWLVNHDTEFTNEPIKRSANYTKSFFEQNEIDFLNIWAERTYDKNNPDHVAAKNYIMDSLGSKTAYWSNELVKGLPEYETYNPRMWSQQGWDNSSGSNVRVSKFKPYTWARIYKKGDANKHIFFTVGVSAKEKKLIYKLDYYFEGNSLTELQKKTIEDNIPQDIRWRTIDNLANYNWNNLIKESAEFITENSHHYDRLIVLVWGNKSNEAPLINTLKEGSEPDKSYSELPPVNPSFSGVDIDFEKESAANRETGDLGEQLVILHERNKLRKLGKPELADKVDKVKDGKGYDVISYDENGKELFIEIKTTTGSNNTPFYFSLNEYLFAEQNLGNYLIYRLYNYDSESNTAEYYIINDPINDLLFRAMSYKAYQKNKVNK